MPNLNVGLVVAFGVAMDANAAYYCPAEACGTDAVVWGLVGSNCLLSETECYGDIKVKTCTSCNTGYTLTSKTGSVSGCSNTISYKSCEQSSSCNNCNGECLSTGWTSAGTGYEKRVASLCNESKCTCDETTSYRCAAGYYGSPSGNMSGCTKCPSYNGIAGTSSAGSTSVSSCCISSGSRYSFSDDIGSGAAIILSACCAS
ncbi:MAG: hypothetical protein IJ273_02510 [Alphaproteobacteria bacterium]|nr:hypothetical protein [Alphaproteobacteria bacterium]